MMIQIDLSWIDGAIGFIAGAAVMMTVIIIGFHIGKDEGGIGK